MRPGFFFLLTVHLSQVIVGDVPLNQVVTGREHLMGTRLPGHEIGRIDIVALALGKAIEEHGTPTIAVGDQNAKAAAATLARAGDALLDEPTPENRVDEAAPSPVNRLAQTLITDALAPGKPNEPCGREYAHPPSIL
jgi:hypothetical protein